MDETPPPARSFADRMREPRVLAAVGGGAALLVLVVVAALLLSHRGDSPVPDAASTGSLQVEAGRTTATGAAASLRCFVDGQLVGEMPLDACAQRNGVSSQALDVGLPPPPPAPAAAPVDPGLQTADAGAAEPAIASAPPPTITPDSPAATDAGPGDDARGQCLRYAAGGWRGAPRGAGSLKACVHALYDGRCVARGDALYGRYGGLTLRAVPGRVEVASDNRSFHSLVGVTADCAVDD